MFDAKFIHLIFFMCLVHCSCTKPMNDLKSKQKFYTWFMDVPSRFLIDTHAVNNYSGEFGIIFP